MKGDRGALEAEGEIPPAAHMVVAAVMIVVVMMRTAVAAFRIVTHPLPDIVTAAVTAHDLVECDDGFAARRVADDTSVAVTGLVCTGGIERKQREAAGDGEDAEKLFHNGWIG